MSIKLPVLNFVKTQYPKNTFKNVKILACQHILDTTHSLFDTMVEMGLKKENTFLLGKCYSTSPISFKKMINEGYNVDYNSFRYNSHEPFDETYQRNIEQFLTKNMTGDKEEKIILLDDGGGLVSVFNQFYSNLSSNVSCVEQTSSGFNRLKNESFSFPIMNIARSHGKLVYETPFIVDSIIESQQFFLQKRRDLNPKNILILGDGVIGKSLKTKMEQNFNIQIFGIRSNVAEIEDKINWNDFDIIIGATGFNIFKNFDFKKLKKSSIIYSVSSSDRELNAIELRKQIEMTTNCRKDLEINGINLVYNGFPMNFSSSEHTEMCVSAQRMQITMGLLLAGCCQSLSETRTGFVDLEMDLQKDIIEQYIKAEK
eukprot:gene4864-8458_t